MVTAAVAIIVGALAFVAGVALGMAAVLVRVGGTILEQRDEAWEHLALLKAGVPRTAGPSRSRQPGAYTVRPDGLVELSDGTLTYPNGDPVPLEEQEV